MKRKILICLFLSIILVATYGIRLLYTDELCNQVSVWASVDDNVEFINQWANGAAKNEAILKNFADGEKLLAKVASPTSEYIGIDLSRLSISESLLSAMYIFRVDDHIKGNVYENISTIGLGIGRDGILIFLGQPPRSKSSSFVELENAIKIRHKNIAVYCR